MAIASTTTTNATTTMTTTTLLLLRLSSVRAAATASMKGLDGQRGRDLGSETQDPQDSTFLRVPYYLGFLI